MKNDITANTVLLSDRGGTLDMVSSEGEVVASIYIPPGRIRASQYTDLVPEGGHLEVAEGIVAFHPRSGVTTQRGRDYYESGANPDFQATNATRDARALRVAVARMHAATNKLEARARSLERLAEMPTNPLLVEPPAPAQKPAEAAAPVVQP